MQTNLADFISGTPDGSVADKILRTCVHCGFCLATCPTYQLTGNELDSPRGRIYLMKQVLEGKEVSDKTRLHLDRCLTCRNCESTCPSGVQYGHLVDIGRRVVEEHTTRPLGDRATRYMLKTVLPKSGLFGSLLALGRVARPLLPAGLQKSIPPKPAVKARPTANHARTMLVLDGCVQPSIAPDINVAAARVLDRLNIKLVAAPRAGCCGAVSYHLNYQEEGLDYMRRNIDAWWPFIEAGAEAIVMTASGCGSQVKDYGHLLRADPAYAEKARRVSELTKDLSEILIQEKDTIVGWLSARQLPRRRKIAYHPPCSLQHGQKIRGVVEQILASANIELTMVPDSHLCCGSAGTYSILQKEMSEKLLSNKIKSLESGKPEEIVTANIGCLTHIAGGTQLPVRHWIDLVDDAMGQPA